MKNGPYELIVAPETYPGKRYRNKYAFSNLQLVTSEEHRKIHAEHNKVPLKTIPCDKCGKERQMAERNYRFKVKHGQKYFFCSQKCQAIKQHEMGGSLRV